MKLKSMVTTAALALLPILSQASVVYEWKTITVGTPGGISLRLEFDDATAMQGGFQFDLSTLDDPFQWPQPSGLIAMDFYVPGTAGIRFTRENGFGAGMGTYTGELNIDVSLGSYLTGSIRAGNFDTGFWMASDENALFGFNNYVSDASLFPCVRDTNSPCTSTGVIQRVEVPEPVTLSLFGGGLFAASFFRRKKAQ